MLSAAISLLVINKKVPYSIDQMTWNAEPSAALTARDAPISSLSFPSQSAWSVARNVVCIVLMRLVPWWLTRNVMQNNLLAMFFSFPHSAIRIIRDAHSSLSLLHHPFNDNSNPPFSV